MAEGPRSYQDIRGDRLLTLRLDISSLRRAINDGMSENEIKKRRDRLLGKLRDFNVDASTVPGARQLFPDVPRPGAAIARPSSGPAVRNALAPRFDPAGVPVPNIGRETVTLYHVTSTDQAKSILKSGRFEAGRVNQFQGFESQIQGLYGWASRERAELALGQLGLDPEDLKGFTVLKVEVPLDEFERRLWPDEDWSLERKDWRQSYRELSSVAIKGDVPARFITEVHTDDEALRSAIAAASDRAPPPSSASRRGGGGGGGGRRPPRPTLPGGGGGSVNDEFFDAMVRHQIGLLRVSGSIRNDVFKLLNATEADMAEKITRRLANHQGLSAPADVRRLQTLMKVLQNTRLKAWNQVTEEWVKQLREVARTEPAFVDGALKTVSPVVLDTVIPSPGLLTQIVQQHPFEGRTLSQWASSIQRTDLRRIEDQIKIGMVQGESSQAIARRVVGTARLRGVDGVTEITRRDAAAITRTAVNAISNQAKREFYVANANVFSREQYVATLDARTTPICRALDGKTYPVGEGPIPPRHFNCRSIRVAVVSGEALGNRPTRNFTEQQLLREFTQRRGLSGVRSRASLPRGTKGDFDQFRQTRVRELTGTTPAKVSYQQWLNRQSAAFQDDVLGKTRGALFRRGGLQLDKFVNRAGDEIPLSRLARLERQAFVEAGLDPEDFL